MKCRFLLDITPMVVRRAWPFYFKHILSFLQYTGISVNGRLRMGILYCSTKDIASPTRDVTKAPAMSRLRSSQFQPHAIVWRTMGDLLRLVGKLVIRERRADFAYYVPDECHTRCFKPPESCRCVQRRCWRVRSRCVVCIDCYTTRSYFQSNSQYEVPPRDSKFSQHSGVHTV
jgi:hypothetical protein